MMSDIPPLDHAAKIGMVARWQPVHRGHVPVLRALTAGPAQAVIGIGSSNEYNYRCPFSLQETQDMLMLVLNERQNYELVPVPDLHNGPRWRAMVLELFGALDFFVTANPYVKSLLADDYKIVHPAALLADADKVPVEGAMVRLEMARGGNWRSLVPESVADYIQVRKLDDRFRQEFGLQTLAIDSMMGD